MGELITALRENGQVIAAAPLAALLWAIVIGGGIYAVVSALNKNQIGDLESRIRLRDDEIADLHRKLDQMKETTESPPPVVRGHPNADNYSDTLRRLTQLYVLSHDGVTPRMLAGMELPPKDWINQELEKTGDGWRVANIQGATAEICEA